MLEKIVAQYGHVTCSLCIDFFEVYVHGHIGRGSTIDEAAKDLMKELGYA